MDKMDKTPIILRFLANSGALISDSHVVYGSWKHGSAYINKDKIFPFTISTSTVCSEIAADFIQYGADVVIGVGINGAILSQWVAAFLTKMDGHEVQALYADKSNDGHIVIRHGFHDLIKKKKVLVVDSTVSKNGCTQKLISAVRKAGGIIIGVSTICIRGKITSEDLDVPALSSLINFEIWDENDCPLCKSGVPINTSVGWGRKYLERKKFLEENLEQFWLRDLPPRTHDNGQDLPNRKRFLEKNMLQHP